MLISFKARLETFRDRNSEVLVNPFSDVEDVVLSTDEYIDQVRVDMTENHRDLVMFMRSREQHRLDIHERTFPSRWRVFQQESETRGRQQAETRRWQQAETRLRFFEQEAETRGRQQAETRGRQQAETRRWQQTETRLRNFQQEAETRGRQQAETRGRFQYYNNNQVHPI
jgi:hypothetical protein